MVSARAAAPVKSPADAPADDPADDLPRPGGRPAMWPAWLAMVVVVASAAVGGIDWFLSARVRAGTDSATRLSALLPYLGVDRTYVLARALGLTALLLAAVSVAMGLELGRRRIQKVAVTPAVGELHRDVSMVVLVLVAAHATVPYLSAVAPYGGWRTALVPFAQPFSWGRRATTFESLGILSFYLLLVAGPICYLLRGRSGSWVIVHRITVVAYVLAVLHALFLGSDFYVAGPARVALVAAQVPVALLVARRLWVPAWRRRYPVSSAAGVGIALGAAAGFAVLAGLVASGAALSGFQL